MSSDFGHHDQNSVAASAACCNFAVSMRLAVPTQGNRNAKQCQRKRKALQKRKGLDRKIEAFVAGPRIELGTSGL